MKGYEDLLLVLRVITFVIACRIVVPAFSISFLNRAVVMQTLSAGWAELLLPEDFIA
jgi:hypothetical protein